MAAGVDMSVTSSRERGAAGRSAASRKATCNGRVSLRGRGPQKAKVTGLQDGLDASLYVQVFAHLQNVAFNRAAGDTENAADIAGALSFLDPGEALKLSHGDAYGREGPLFGGNNGWGFETGDAGSGGR